MGIFTLSLDLQSHTVSKIRQPERGQIENPFQVTARGREAVLLDFFNKISTDFRT